LTITHYTLNSQKGKNLALTLDYNWRLEVGFSFEKGCENEVCDTDYHRSINCWMGRFSCPCCSIIAAWANKLPILPLASTVESLRTAKTGDFSEYPQVTAPPESFFEKVREPDRQAARQFYKKYMDVKSMPVVASAEVANLALQRTYEIVTHMLAGRPDVLEAMVERGMYLVIIGKNQVYTDLPENRNARNPDYLTSVFAAPAAFRPASARRTC
jgi:hypothetical protein